MMNSHGSSKRLRPPKLAAKNSGDLGGLGGADWLAGLVAKVERPDRPLWRVIWCTWWCVFTILALVMLTGGAFDPLSFDSAGLALGIFGGVFAIYSMAEAHEAVATSEDVLRAIQSFRVDFKEIIQDFIDIIDKAEREVYVLLPTPAYGYLFGAKSLSEILVDKLKEKALNDGIYVRLLFVAGDLPSDYLRLANGLGVFNEYVSVTESIFHGMGLSECTSENHEYEFENDDLKNYLTLLCRDPFIRIVVADPESDNRNGFLAFVQDKQSEGQFKAKGFASQQREMVNAMVDLFNLYRSELKSDNQGDDLTVLFTEVSSQRT